MLYICCLFLFFCLLNTVFLYVLSFLEELKEIIIIIMCLLPLLKRFDTTENLKKKTKKKKRLLLLSVCRYGTKRFRNTASS